MYINGSRGQLTSNYRKAVVIKGGANVKDKYTLHTPLGAVTEVTDEEFEFLQKNDAFQRHVANGFMKIMDNTPNLNTSDMEKKDGCAQLNDADHALYSETTASCGYHDRYKGRTGAGFVA